MITRKFYLIAQQVVREYEAQFDEARVIGSLQPDSGLKRNDYVIYIGGKETIQLTVGKKYRLTRTPWVGIGGDMFIRVINDKGYSYTIQADYFRLQ